MNNDVNYYVLLTSGRGPVECTRVVNLVTKEFVCSAKLHGIACGVIDNEPAGGGCNYSIRFAVSGDGKALSDFRNEWEGSILWVAKRNPFRPHHKRKNWFVGIRFFKPLERNEMKDSDIVYDTMRSGGHGGQNVNKVETSVRATHVPSGLSVVASDERSQYRNKEIARERLLAKLSELREIEELGEERCMWMSHNTLERGNPVKKFTGDL